MNSTCIIYYHGTDWGGLQGRQQYLMRALSERAAVAYLDGSVTPGRRVVVEARTQNLMVVRGLAATLMSLRRRGLHAAARLYAAFHLRFLHRRFQRIIFWSAETTVRAHEYVGHDLLVFDCIDPCFDESGRADHDARERAVLARADVVFTTSDLLLERCRALHGNAVLVNNGCAPEEYAPERVESAARPAWWPADMAPVAAYLGSIDWRIDLESIECACRRNPSVKFVVAGNVLPQQAQRVNQLHSLGNVIVPGRISVDEGRYLLSHCDIGLIPFTPGEMNDAINPVKMYAYALLGKPVVGTGIRELLSRPMVAACGASDADFARCIGPAIELGRSAEHRRRLIDFAMANTWRHRASAAFPLLAAIGDFRRGRRFRVAQRG
jgi:hypothetical protein